MIVLLRYSPSDSIPRLKVDDLAPLACFWTATVRFIAAKTTSMLP